MSKPKGEEILELARQHLGQQYVLGALAPKNDPGWAGPWDCAEFASWAVYQVSGILYGCDRETGNPATADAYTGYWEKDARKRGEKVSVEEAGGTPGAAVLRVPREGARGHIVISDGRGGTVEAHSPQRGVIAHKLSGRVWDMGILVPGIRYTTSEAPVALAPPATVIYRLKKPAMTGATVREIQRALREAGFDPKGVDGKFGRDTHNAVVAFQVSRGLIADGQVGAQTAGALGVKLPAA